MFYKIVFLFIISGYVFGAPIFNESLQFRIVECIPGDNETLAKHIIEITNINETCIRVNESTITNNQIYLYVVPETEYGVKVQIKTENCSSPLPELHFSLCDEPNNLNQTENMATFHYEKITVSDLSNEENNSTTTTISPMFYTGPTVYETLHQLNDDDDDDHEVTTKINDSSEE
ncbi:unnamed protein product [Adineta ricciae]|uniref:Uncharacterized protein n=1 Tax=Adineta ricciae TaxID=249248 RepID=A0A813ZUZ9_ADIRI|nr:unnamed protein product [Adineta ricciae]CAF1367047.1 unnamed protein product [Adineta ricciae]